MRIGKKIDLNTLLMLGSILVCILSIFAFNSYGKNPYINIYSIYLLSGLCIFNIIMLFYEKRIRDPFIILLVYINLFFYNLRVFTLIILPYSIPFLRYPFNYHNLNSSLLFILFANIALFLGLLLANGRTKSCVYFHDDKLPSKPYFIIFLLLLIILINYYGIIKIEFVNKAFRVFVNVFLNIYLLFFLTLLYLILNFKILKRNPKILLISVLIFFLLSITLLGTRSAILTLFQFFLFVFLAINGKIVLNFKLVVLGISFGILSVYIFLMLQGVRRIEHNTETTVTSKKVDAVQNFKVAKTKDMALLFRPLTDRLGFLDYASDLITNRDKYKVILNPLYYTKSIIDNGLSPGFNIFDTPTASHSLKYIYQHLTNKPTHKDIEKEYNSDMFTMYGEYYVLFGGYFSLFFIFISAYFFKRIYLRIHFKETYWQFAIKAFILLVFLNWLNSFGLDWIIIELVSFFFTLLLYKFFIKVKLLKKSLNSDSPVS